MRTLQKGLATPLKKKVKRFIVIVGLSISLGGRTQQMFTTTTKQQIFIKNWKITNYITFPPANSLWTNRGGGSWRHITKQELYIDGLNNSEDTTIQ